VLTASEPRPPKALVFYHYLHPDDVVSSVLFSELCAELVRRGWDVEARPGNRSWREEARHLVSKEQWCGVDIRRVWRPAFSQTKTLGRFSNAIWMIFRWSLAALTERPDFIIVGTDPILSVTVAGVWRVLRPRTRIAHWCFDLYPEAAVADGILRPGGWFTTLLKPILAHAYRSCDLLGDIGPCMSQRIRARGSKGRQVTLTPWALAEPALPLPINKPERVKIFANSPLALIYSGSFGRAHSSALILQLARRLDPYGARVAFSVRGNRADLLRREAAAVPNITFVPFTAQENLEVRLSAADIHVVSLREEWTGTVVPSKFFAALAVGRPVLFTGSQESSIAHWIREHKVGWVLTESTMDVTTNELLRYCRDPHRLPQLFEHCHAVYQRHFSKRSVVDLWDAELRDLLEHSQKHFIDAKELTSKT
jgi:glycosyltransferase involved in cell wall biosynthesis